MMRMFRRLGTWSAMGCAIGVTLPWLAAGCGGETLPPVDVASLNAELAQAESGLADRLAELEGGEVAAACHFAASALEEGERRFAELPAGEVEERVALAATLAQFREEAAGMEGEVEAAGREETAARKDAAAALEVLRETRRRFGEEVEPELSAWAGKARETTAQLLAWREQRLEKMEDRQFATFSAFHEAASVRYREWTAWAERAGVAGTMACGELLPAARAAVERLEARAEDAHAARARVEEGIGKLRAMPLSPGLIATARKAAIATYNKTIRGAAVAMEEMEESTAGCPEDVWERAETLLKAADALENTATGVSGDIREQMDRGAMAAATAAVERARKVHGEVTAGADEFETVRNRLRADWYPIGGQVQAAADAANEVQKMARIDEEDLTRDVALIESLRRRIEEAKIEEWCEWLVAFRVETAGKLAEAEEELARAGDAHAAAMTAAERKSARIALGNLRASLDKRPAPGYTRPEKTVERARSLIDGFLADMDAKTDDAFMADYKKVADNAGKLVDEIVDQTVWTPGTRHPDIPNIHAADRERTWGNDPGYEFVDSSPGSTNIIVRWKPGAWRQDHPNVTAGQTEGTWMPNPGYKARWKGDLDPVWTKGTRHPTKPHVFATSTEHTWDADPGYWFVRPGTNCDLVVRWEPGRSHPDHPHVTAGQTEGTWVPDPGYRARWTGDLDPVWTKGTRHPDHPHIHATDKELSWATDPGYVPVAPGTSGNLAVRWEPGQRHPDHPHVSAGQTEGTWMPDPGFKARWSGDLEPRWTEGTRHPDHPHIHATDEELSWATDPGYVPVAPGTSGNLAVRWEPGQPHPRYPHVHAGNKEGTWSPDAGYRFRSLEDDGDFSVEWVGR